MAIAKALKQSSRKRSLDAVEEPVMPQSVNVIPEHPQVVEVAWKIPDKREARLHFVDGDMPWCRRKQKRPVRLKSSIGEGFGISAALMAGVPLCPTCKRIFSVTYDYAFASEP